MAFEPQQQLKCPKCGAELGEAGVLVTTKRVRLFGRVPFGKEMVRLGTIGDEEIDGMQCKACYTVLHGPCVETLRIAIA